MYNMDIETNIPVPKHHVMFHATASGPPACIESETNYMTGYFDVRRIEEPCSSRQLYESST
jgi:hypothetical protein